jgi:hypothetical protein
VEFAERELFETHNGLELAPWGEVV